MKKMTLQELQKFSLDILKDVHSFCMQNGIKYSLAYGTLIGAIRHKGFIPWDDDIDIIMPRDDFERFCETYNSARFHIISPKDNECWIAFARVCDLDKTYAESICNWCKRDTGVWIDIFPADGVSDNSDKFKESILFGRKLWIKQLYCRYAKHAFDTSLSLIYNFKLLAVKIITLNGIRLRRHIKRLTNNARQYKFGNTKHWSQIVCLDVVEKKYQDTHDFDKTVEVDFENEKFCALEGYDNFLRNIYGNYMKLPPVEDQIPKQDDVIFYWKNI